MRRVVLNVATRVAGLSAEPERIQFEAGGSDAPVALVVREGDEAEPLLRAPERPELHPSFLLLVLTDRGAIGRAASDSSICEADRQRGAGG